MNNISEKAVKELIIGTEILDYFRSTPNAGIVYRSDEIDACYWKAYAVPLTNRKQIEIYKKINAPVPARLLKDCWKDYGFLDDAFVLTQSRVNWMMELRQLEPKLKTRIDFVLAMCERKVAEEELIRERIRWIVAKQDAEYKSTIQSEESRTIKVTKQKHARTTSNTQSFDFIVPETSWDRFRKLAKSDSGLAIKKLGELKVTLPFETKDGADKYATSESGRDISKIEPFSFSTDSDHDYFPYIDQQLRGLPVKSKFDRTRSEMHVPKHYVVEETYVYGTVSTEKIKVSKTN